ncbi:polysaccharide deacetylase family protein [Bacillus horti]|uniref:Peptidoglycan/xylan/chitin deacetylase (PgdA/CDA1 family) n=1 Tax=Caldalkalibacillus horti TaxID=77523 RepID=A0ABT9VZD2_9BACI|nr:polysaccharide deacetylase family protein [Bacillus horti]MDQ0166359.1 peptidoglycan/xylan/chitin deacetylase (PgdA/CDA1 family) [Bacillus horti]
MAAEKEKRQDRIHPLKWALMVSLIVFILSSSYFLYYELEQERARAQGITTEEQLLASAQTIDENTLDQELEQGAEESNSEALLTDGAESTDAVEGIVNTDHHPEQQQEVLVVQHEEYIEDTNVQEPSGTVERPNDSRRNQNGGQNLDQNSNQNREQNGYGGNQSPANQSGEQHSNEDQNLNGEQQGSSESSNLKESFQGYVPILMYHSFKPGGSTSVEVDPEDFREQLTYLKNQGYETITEYDLVEAIHGTKELPAKPLLITIDDGYLNNYTYAYPILRELGMKASIYVVTKHRGEQPGRYEHFTWEQAKEMVDSGVITIQSHTHNLHSKKAGQNGLEKALVQRMLLENGSLESEGEHRQRIKEDFQQSKQLIEQHVGKQAVALAFPFGTSNAEAVAVARELGYLLLFSIDRGVFYLDGSTHRIPRFNVPGGTTGQEIEAMLLQYADR